EHVRIARDLHDGIGHALTIVSVQAAAGGRIADRDPAAAAQALGRIERTAREALAELDQVLADLRTDRTDGADDAGPMPWSEKDPPAHAPDRHVPERDRRGQGPLHEPDARAVAGPSLEDRLDQVLADHRRAGMDLHAELSVPQDVAVPQQEHVVRIVSEMLTNRSEEHTSEL